MKFQVLLILIFLVADDGELHKMSLSHVYSFFWELSIHWIFLIELFAVLVLNFFSSWYGLETNILSDV